MGQQELSDLQAAVDRLQDEVRTLRSALQATDVGAVLLRQGEEFARLLSISKMIVAELDLARVYEQVASSAREIVDAETVIVPMLNDARDRYTYLAAAGVDADAVRGSSFGAHVGMCGWVLQHGRSLLFGETSTLWMDETTPWEAGQQSAVLVPLIGRKGIIGGLSALGKRGGGCFRQHDLDLLTMFANQVSIAIENAQLFQEVTREIEERRKAEELLRASESRLRLATSAGSIGVWDWNIVKNELIWDDSMYTLYGIRKGEFGEAYEAWSSTIHPDDREYVEGEIQAALRGEREYAPEFRIIRPDGSIRNLKADSWTIRDGEHRPLRMIGTNFDLTARKEAEEKLQASESFVRTILDTVDQGFIVVDRDYRIQISNRAYCENLAVPADEVVGKHCYAVSHGTSRPCFEKRLECAVQQAFADGSPHTVLHKHAGQGESTLFVETKAFPLKDGAGNVVSAIEVVSNITERQLLEEERLKTQKLEAVGTLAGGIAHDFNNLLQGVFGFISLAKLKLEDQVGCLSALEEAEKALHMSVRLTNQLLTFSRGGTPIKKTIDLLPVIQNAARFALSGSRTDCRVVSDPELWQVDADEGQISQVIQNIVLNADQAMPDGGRVDITARNVQAPGPNQPQGLRAGSYVAIAINDTGVGISEQYLARIFDPYFTTKKRGSGLGLATSYSIIKNHNGAIDVKSEVGRGTVFSLYLPAVAAGREEVRGRHAPEATPGRTGKVLVMDDDQVIREVARALIAALGHRVELAAHGQEAIERYQEARRAGDPFDVVVLDLTIRGGLGGAETIKRMLEVDPDVSAVVSSGYSDDDGIAGYLEQGFKAVLKKPYDVDELREVLRRLMTS